MKILILIMLFVSTQTFACKLDGPMAGSGAFVKGIMSKLYETKRYRSYELVSLVKTSLVDYDVLVKDTLTNKCIKLVMKPYGTGSSCTFTASIKSQSSTSCK